VKEGTRLGGFVHRTVKTDKDGNVREAWSCAPSSSRQGRGGAAPAGVEVNLTYMARGQPGKATIVADQGMYAPAQQKAIFQGHVHLTTEDGMDLKTDQLIYRGDHNSVKSDTTSSSSARTFPAPRAGSPTTGRRASSSCSRTST
jgi:hypothetical protein